MLSVILTAMVTLTGCGDDDAPENPMTASELIVGSWQSVSSVNWTKIDGELVDGDTEDEFSYDGLKLTFDAGGAFKMQERNAGGQWPSPVSGMWKVINGNHLQISVNSMYVGYTIESISGDMLIIDMTVRSTTLDGKREESYAWYKLKRVN